VTCRVLKLARQPCYRWLAAPVTDAQWAEAQVANALFDAHRNDPEFGYRFLADEARAHGYAFADRTAWRICSDNGWFSVFGKKKHGRKVRPSAPAHDDLVRRDFTAAGPNTLWLSDITEHPTPLDPDRCDDCWNPSARGQAVCLRGQGRVVQPDRGLFHR
jgi:putative transposase